MAETTPGGPSTRDNGRLESADIPDAPLERGTDPLGDRAVRPDGTGEAAPRYRSTAQLVLATLLLVLFAGFLFADISNGDYGRATLGVLVVGVCALIIARELRASRRPRR